MHNWKVIRGLWFWHQLSHYHTESICTVYKVKGWVHSEGCEQEMPSTDILCEDNQRGFFQERPNYRKGLWTPETVFFLGSFCIFRFLPLGGNQLTPLCPQHNVLPYHSPETNIPIDYGLKSLKLELGVAIHTFNPSRDRGRCIWARSQPLKVKTIRSTQEYPVSKKSLKRN